MLKKSDSIIVYPIDCLVMSTDIFFFALKLKHLTHMANLNRLKVVLAEQEKTGKWILEQIGKSNYTVSKWCSNKVQPDLQTLDRIAKVLMLTKEC